MKGGCCQDFLVVADDKNFKDEEASFWMERPSCGKGGRGKKSTRKTKREKKLERFFFFFVGLQQRVKKGGRVGQPIW